MGVDQRFSGVAGFGYVEIVREAAARRLPARRARRTTACRSSASPAPAWPTRSPTLTVPGIDLCQITKLLGDTRDSGQFSAYRRRPPAHGHEMFEVVAPGLPRRRRAEHARRSAARARPAGSSACSTPSRSCAPPSPARPASSVTLEREHVRRCPRYRIPTGAGAAFRTLSETLEQPVGRPLRPARRPATALSTRISVEADGRWTVTVSRAAPRGHLRPRRPGRARASSIWLVMGLLAFGLVQVLARGRARALRMVEEKTGQLRHQALHDALTGLPNRALIMDRAEQMLAHARRNGTDGVGDVHRPRRLQGRQRHVRPPGRRRAAARRRRADRGRAARDRHDRPPRRRRVRRAGRGRRGADRRAHPRRAARAVRPRHRQRRSRSRRRSASPPATARRPRTCCATPTSRSTRPRAPAATATPSSATRCTSPRTTGSRSRTTCAARSPATSCSSSTSRSSTSRRATITAVEALLRWQHATRGLVPPTEFIALAEESGLIVDIGAWVLETACEQAAPWAANGTPIAHLGQRLRAPARRPGAAARPSRHALRDSGLDGDQLILEITETALMRDAEAAAELLRELKAHGVHVAIDDFGTGYSSLAYLQQLPVDSLKIDRTFIAASARSRESDPLIADARPARPLARAAHGRRGHRGRGASSPTCASSAATPARATCSRRRSRSPRSSACWPSSSASPPEPTPMPPRG